jgi:hypothetical protein
VLARELPIVLRARLTWLAAALSALLVGHGFVLAVDLYSAGSRSVGSSRLLAHQFDPLLGIVRPTLGGLYLAVSLLGPLVATRALAIERERRTLGPLLLTTNAPTTLLAAKYVAALAGMAVQLLAPLALLIAWLLVGGHLAGAETATALAAHAVYLALVAALATAAAAWTATLAQAATVALLIVAASWAIDAAEGFSAFAWLGRALDWSVTTHLAPMEHGTLALGALAWMIVVALGALAIAWIGLRGDLSRSRRAALLVAALSSTARMGMAAHRLRRAYDVSELHRGSLPPAAIASLRAIAAPIRIDVYLDRDDARRHQLESDALAKLRLARPDLDVRTPLDDRPAPAEGEREEGYGRIVLHVDGVTRETFSTSDQELSTLVFAAAGRAPPSWEQPEYPGHPLVVDGAPRRILIAFAYVILPLALVGVGWLVTRPARRIT